MRFLIVEIFSARTLFLIAIIFQVAFAPGNYSVSAQGRAAVSSIIYDNGPLATGTLSRSGTTAPAGTQWSELSYDYGSTTETNTAFGFGCHLIVGSNSNRCADDFKVPVGQTWTINQVIVFSYQTNNFGTTSPVTGATLRIWNGRPGDPGSTVVFGDTFTNRLGSSTDALMYRIANSGPPTNTIPGTTRKIWQTNINVTPTASLPAGDYWIDFQTDAGPAGSFAPSSTVTGSRTLLAWNARQFSSSTGLWADMIDVGNPTFAPDVAQDLPFKLNGSVSGAPVAPRSRTIDFNGDNKTDLVVARASSATSQSTWWINDGATVRGIPWGLGVGYAGGDIPTPRDFDGDGKTDLSVWRTNISDPANAYFFTLQSSNNVVVATQFGRTGDDPTIVEDYDGDGLADYAVFRATPVAGDPCGAQSVWYYKPSASPLVPFSYACWGTTGDRPYPGDFDGDRKADIVVIRNSGGSAVHYQMLSGGEIKVFNYGLSGDKFVSGDFDGDGKTDLCAVRDSGTGHYDWYVINSSNGQFLSVGWGASATDFVVPGDYDGDGRSDFAVWRSGSGTENGYFYELRSASSPVAEKFGTSSVAFGPADYPVASSVGVH